MRIKSEKINYVLFFILIVSFVFPINLATGLTNSGIVVLYLANFIYIYFFIYNLIQIIRRINKLDHKTKELVAIYFLIGIEYIFITVVRFLSKQYYYKSFVMCFWIVMPLSLFFLVINKNIDRKKFLITLYYSMSTINILSIIYHLFIARAFKTEFLGNVNIVIFCALIGLILNILYGIEIKNKKSILIIFNFAYYIFIVSISGSRAGFIIGSLAVLGVVLYSVIVKRLKKEIILGLLIGTFISFISIISNFYYSRDLFFRGINLSTISSSLDEFSTGNINIDEINQIMQNISENNTENDEKKQQEILLYNDVGRLLYWKEAIKEIKKSPLIGTGNITVGDNGQGSGQTAHNFILEYWLVFGGIGLILWIVYVILVIRNIIKINLKHKGRGNIYLIFFFLFLVCGYSLLQPTMVSSIGPTLVWSMLAVFYSKESNNDSLVTWERGKQVNEE